MELPEASDKHNTSIKPALRRILGAVLILCFTGAVLHWKHVDDLDEHYSIRIVEPTCTEKGYSLYTHRVTGAVIVDDLIDAKGHTFEQWMQTDVGDDVNCGFTRRICKTCGLEETQAVYPDLSISRISLYGSMNGIGKKTAVPMTVCLDLKEDDIFLECYATLKYQGHSSLSYDKKNYTLKLYKDEGLQEKNKLTLSHWNKEHKYILKADYVDASQCRNLVSADVWADMCASRPSVAKELKTLSNYGSVDGYPVAVYINDRFHGLFTMNLHKDDDLFAMQEGAKHAIMISNHGNAPEAIFHAEAEFTENSPWEVEFCGTEDSTWAKDSFNQLIRFVRTSDDAVFREELSDYLDVDAAIDYLIALYALGLTNYMNQDMVLVSYGDIWIPSMYDMETAFGLSEDGFSWQEPTALLPVCTDSGWDSGTGNLLWDRLLRNFGEEICIRYQTLREQILDPQLLCNRVAGFTDRIPAAIYEAEEAINPHPKSYEESKMQILTYIPGRIEALDKIFLKGLN